MANILRSLVFLLVFVVPVFASASTREDRFAICVSVQIPGMGAAYKGHTGRGVLQFVGTNVGTALAVSGATNEKQELVPVGLLIAAGFYTWSLIDAFTLEPTEKYINDPLPRNWRPATPPPSVPPARVPPTPEPPGADADSETAPDELEADNDAPPETAKPVHVPDPAGRTFIKTQSAGLQEVEVGRRVRATRTDGTTVIGVIEEVSDVAIVLDEGGERVTIYATELGQVYAAPKR